MAGCLSTTGGGAAPPLWKAPLPLPPATMAAAAVASARGAPSLSTASLPRRQQRRRQAAAAPQGGRRGHDRRRRGSTAGGGGRGKQPSWRCTGGWRWEILCKARIDRYQSNLELARLTFKIRRTLVHLSDCRLTLGETKRARHCRGVGCGGERRCRATTYPPALHAMRPSGRRGRGLQKA